MVSRGFVKLVVSKFGSIPGLEFSGKLLEPRLTLIRDKPGFQLQVHTDDADVALVLMVYLSIDSPLRGTQLYQPLKGFEAHDGRHRPVEEFQRVQRVSVVAGSGMCFPRTENSFHAVNRGQVIGSRRDVLIYTLKWGDPSHARGIRARLRRVYDGNFGWPLDLSEN
jgi:hypothetical protein